MYSLRRILMLFAVAMAVSLAGHAATDMFMQIAEIPGEASDENHTDWIQVLSFSHSMKQAVSHDDASAGGRVAQRAILGDFKVSKTLDKASPKLAMALCNGTKLATVEIELVSIGATTAYMTYKLENVMVTSISTGGSGGEHRMTEEVAFTYQKITWTYTVFDPATGIPTGIETGGWDRDTRQELP